MGWGGGQMGLLGTGRNSQRASLAVAGASAPSLSSPNAWASPRGAQKKRGAAPPGSGQATRRMSAGVGVRVGLRVAVPPMAL